MGTNGTVSTGTNPVLDFYNQNAELLHIAGDWSPLLELTAIVCPQNGTVRADYLSVMQRYVCMGVPITVLLAHAHGRTRSPTRAPPRPHAHMYASACKIMRTRNSRSRASPCTKPSLFPIPFRPSLVLHSCCASPCMQAP